MVGLLCPHSQLSVVVGDQQLLAGIIYQQEASLMGSPFHKDGLSSC